MISSVKRLLILQRGPLWWLIQQRMCLQCGGPRFKLWVGKIPWRREWLPSPVFLSGEFHGQSCSPLGCKELDTTERLTLSLSLYFAKKKNWSTECNCRCFFFFFNKWLYLLLSFSFRAQVFLGPQLIKLQNHLCLFPLVHFIGCSKVWA